LPIRPPRPAQLNVVGGGCRAATTPPASSGRPQDAGDGYAPLNAALLVAARRVPVRLRAHSNSRVRVPDLADTVGPITESNCAGATSPGGEQLEVNEQSVTRFPSGNKVNSIRSAVLASLLAQRRSPNKIVRPALREWIASGREPQMVGDGMLGSSSDVNQGTTAGGIRAGRGQSPRSSEEAGNDRGAKGDRDVVLGDVRTPFQKSSGSAERLFARMRRKTGPGVGRRPNSGPPAKQVSGARACAAGAIPPKPRNRVPEPVHQTPQPGKPDAGEPPVRFGWGATAQAVLYPHPTTARGADGRRTAPPDFVWLDSPKGRADDSAR
jgi:hypothetical protein